MSQFLLLEPSKCYAFRSQPVNGRVCVLISSKNAYVEPAQVVGVTAQIGETSYRNGGVFTHDWGDTSVLYIDGRPIDRTKKVDYLTLSPGKHDLVIHFRFNSPQLEACPCVVWSEVTANFENGIKYKVTGMHIGAKAEITVFEESKPSNVVLKKIEKFGADSSSSYTPVIIYQ